jgi:hypothetical protein
MTFTSNLHLGNQTGLFIKSIPHTNALTCSSKLSPGIVLFISSPHSEWYKDFVKQKMAIKWFFPVWTLAELQTCQRHCYPDLPIEMLQERYRICGGVARLVFHDEYSIPMPYEMQIALSDIHAVCGVRFVGDITKIFPSSHTLSK